MQAQKSLNTALLVAILFAQFAKEPQQVVAKPFEIKPAAAATVEAPNNEDAQKAKAVNRPYNGHFKDPVSFYTERQARLIRALTK